MSLVGEQVTRQWEWMFCGHCQGSNNENITKRTMSPDNYTLKWDIMVTNGS